MRDKLGYCPSTTHNISWQSPQRTLNCQRSTDSSNGGQKAVNVMQTKVLSLCLASPAKIILGPKHQLAPVFVTCLADAKSHADFGAAYLMSGYVRI